MASDVEQAFSDLADVVTRLTTVKDSTIAFERGLKAQLDAALALGNPTAIIAQVKAVSNQIGVDADEMAASIVANTLAAP